MGGYLNGLPHVKQFPPLDLVQVDLASVGLRRRCRVSTFKALSSAVLGHELPFAVTRNQVCNAAMNRH